MCHPGSHSTVSLVGKAEVFLVSLEAMKAFPSALLNSVSQAKLPRLREWIAQSACIASSKHRTPKQCGTLNKGNTAGRKEGAAKKGTKSVTTVRKLP